MPVRDCAEFLGAAIDSVLAQTCTDLELLVVDDGSTDASPAVAQNRAGRDRRVRVIRTDPDGLPTALNRGIDAARGPYVARADADDVSLPQRLAAQVAFLERHPAVGVCGSAMATIGRGPTTITRLPENPRTLHCMLLFQSPLAHPTVMMRRELLDEHRYDAKLCDGAEDYDLWERLAERTVFSNLPEVLYRRRVHPRQMSTTRLEQADRAARRIRERQLDRLLRATAEERDVHQALCTWRPLSPPALRRTRPWLERLVTANVAAGIYPEPELRAVVAERWYRACADSGARGLDAPIEYLRSPLGEGRRAVRLALRNNVPASWARALVQMRERLRHRRSVAGDQRRMPRSSASSVGSSP